jgi:uncharacterized protein YfaS (alpha-2-macroglobulin family)
MGSVITFLIARGVPAKFARPLAIAALVMALLAAMGGLKCAYDRNLIRDHQAAQAAANARADRKADARAAETRRADDARLTQESTQLEKVQANAPNDTARRLARHRCLRLQQAARRDGKQPPACD